MKTGGSCIVCSAPIDARRRYCGDSCRQIHYFMRDFDYFNFPKYTKERFLKRIFNLVDSGFDPGRIGCIFRLGFYRITGFFPEDVK